MFPFDDVIMLKIRILMFFHWGKLIVWKYPQLTSSVPSILGPLYLHELTLIPAFISNHMLSEMWDDITYPFSNFNGCTIKVWEWIILSSHTMMDVHYIDVIMGVIASQITRLSIVYSKVNSEADQRKLESSTSLAFVKGIHQRLVNSPHKWPVMQIMFPFDDVIMITYTCYN